MKKRLLYQFLGAIIGTSICSVLSSFILLKIQEMYPDINIGGDKATIFGFLFIGFPIGISIGMFIVDLKLYKYNASFLGFVLCLLLCFFIGGFGGVILLAFSGALGVIIIPLLYLGAALSGYYLPQKSRIENKGG